MAAEAAYRTSRIGEAQTLLNEVRARARGGRNVTLGFSPESMFEPIATDVLDLPPSTSRVFVRYVAPGTAADDAGLRAFDGRCSDPQNARPSSDVPPERVAHDVIQSVDGTPVITLESFFDAVDATAPGAQVNLEVLRLTQPESGTTQSEPQNITVTAQSLLPDVTATGQALPSVDSRLFPHLTLPEEEGWPRSQEHQLHLKWTGSMKRAVQDQDLVMADDPSTRGRDEHDRGLMERVREEDIEALETLLHRYWPRIALYAADIVGTVDEGRDIAQETFIRLWQTRHRWVARGSVRSLLFGLAHNLAIDHLRRPTVRLRQMPRLERFEGPTPATPAEVTEARELDAALEEAIKALPPRRREVFVLIHGQGLSHDEVAAVMGISPQTVANQMSSALSQLRIRLQRLLRDPD